MSAALPQQQLPRQVVSMRRRIARAAAACDYAALERLARENGRTFTFTYSAAFRSPAEYWRRLEASGRDQPLAKLLKLLKLRVIRERGVYFWPAAHRRNATAADWAEVRSVYSQVELERMRRQGSGYLGYRIGIAANGDWQYFVAGD